MAMEVEVNAAPEVEAEAEAPAAEMLPDDVAPQVALAIVALQEALGVECSSVSIEGLSEDGDVTLVCVPTEGETMRYAVSADVMSAALDEIEPETVDA